jgi:hypothetical protein
MASSFGTGGKGTATPPSRYHGHPGLPRWAGTTLAAEMSTVWSGVVSPSSVTAVNRYSPGGITAA